MRVKVNDSIVPEREVKLTQRSDAEHIFVTMQDVVSVQVGLTITMSYKEAYDLATDLLDVVGGLYGAKSAN